MFYRPADGHGLRHNPFNAIISPRPIAWLSTTGSLGDNLAPYSFFNVFGEDPAVLAISVGPRPEGSAKDTLAKLTVEKPLLMAEVMMADV
jgi:flavin reductase (DIM6/NTAB) family NADH-FMN oxidoreductase RutF